MRHLLTTDVPSMMKIWVAPELVIASFVGMVNVALANAGTELVKKLMFT
jgi:hypothetical protein